MEARRGRGPRSCASGPTPLLTRCPSDRVSDAWPGLGRKGASGPIPGDVSSLPLMDSLPAGCILHPITDGASWPHLKPGEFAVVDTADRTPCRGELFVIQYSSGRRLVVEAFRHPRVMDETDGRGCWCVGSLARARSVEEINQRFAAGDTRHMTYDGPYSRAEYLAEKLVGRVVGTFAPAFNEA